MVRPSTFIWEFALNAQSTLSIIGKCVDAVPEEVAKGSGQGVAVWSALRVSGRTKDFLFTHSSSLFFL